MMSILNNLELKHSLLNSCCSNHVYHVSLSTFTYIILVPFCLSLFVFLFFFFTFFRCKRYEVPIEKTYNKTQREKFAWAIDMAEKDFVF